MFIVCAADERFDDERALGTGTEGVAVRTGVDGGRSADGASAARLVANDDVSAGI